MIIGIVVAGIIVALIATQGSPEQNTASDTDQSEVVDDPTVVTEEPAPLDGADDSSEGSFVGTWTGPINQPGSWGYTTELTIAQTADGAYTGTVRYPELGNCAGYLSDITVSGERMTATENITTTPGSCVQTVSLELVLEGNTLRYAIPTGSGSGTTGTLNQVRPPSEVELSTGTQ
ncbi:hypothetical protein C5D04_00430 [Rathayibacter sp. AY1D2]|nr:hypothetical protein C5D04_00430 [Rathayibacter sp. AY1D2]